MAKDCKNESKPRPFKDKKVLTTLREAKVTCPNEEVVPKAIIVDVGEECHSPLKKGDKVMQSLNLWAKALEGGFEARLNVLTYKKGFVYLKGKLNGTNISLFLDTRVINSFVNTKCAKRMELEVGSTKEGVKVAFVQGSGLAIGVVAGLSFEVGGTKFVKDFTMYDLGGIDFVLRNTFLDF